MTFKAEQHGLTLKNEKYSINSFDCSQLPMSIVIINEVHMQLVTTDEQTSLDKTPAIEVRTVI